MRAHRCSMRALQGGVLGDQHAALAAAAGSWANACACSGSASPAACSAAKSLPVREAQMDKDVGKLLGKLFGWKNAFGFDPDQASQHARRRPARPVQRQQGDPACGWQLPVTVRV